MRFVVLFSCCAARALGAVILAGGGLNRLGEETMMGDDNAGFKQVKQKKKGGKSVSGAGVKNPRFDGKSQPGPARKELRPAYQEPVHMPLSLLDWPQLPAMDEVAVVKKKHPAQEKRRQRMAEEQAKKENEERWTELAKRKALWAAAEERQRIADEEEKTRLEALRILEEERRAEVRRVQEERRAQEQRWREAEAREIGEMEGNDDRLKFRQWERVAQADELRSMGNADERTIQRKAEAAARLAHKKALDEANRGIVQATHDFVEYFNNERNGVGPSDDPAKLLPHFKLRPLDKIWLFLKHRFSFLNSFKFNHWSEMIFRATQNDPWIGKYMPEVMNQALVAQATVRWMEGIENPVKRHPQLVDLLDGIQLAIRAYLYRSVTQYVEEGTRESMQAANERLATLQHLDQLDPLPPLDDMPAYHEKAALLYQAALEKLATAYRNDYDGPITF